VFVLPPAIALCIFSLVIYTQGKLVASLAFTTLSMFSEFSELTSHADSR
jgi:hypothetical protein